MLRRNGNEAGACKYQRKYKQREHPPPLAMHTKDAEMGQVPRHSRLCNAQTENRALRRINAETSRNKRAAKTRSHSRQMRRDFRPTSPRAFGQLGLNCPTRGNAGFKGGGETGGWSNNRGPPMTKLMAVAAFLGAAYLFDPTFAGSLDAQMRVFAWRINSALDVRPYLGG
jgi:hypothetical protein